MLFGSGADIVPSEEPVRVRLPDITSSGSGPGATAADAEQQAQQERADLAAMLRQTRGGGAPAAAAGEGGSSEEDDEEMADAEAAELRQLREQQHADNSSSSSDDEAEGDETAARRQGGSGASADGELDPAKAAAAAAAYAARDAAGAPQPLTPQLVTLSMLPRTQWQNLVHLDTIKARNKPVEPPKKPAAAPFFLPTLAGVDGGRNPVFDFAAAPGAAEGGDGAEAADPELAAKAAAAWGDGEDAEEADEQPGSEAMEQDGEGGSGGEGEEGSGAGGAAARRRASAGRVLRTAARAEHSQLVRLLHACARSGDWTSLVAHLRALPPTTVDAEIRGMQVCCAGSQLTVRNGLGVGAQVWRRSPACRALLLPGQASTSYGLHPVHAAHPLPACPHIPPFPPSAGAGAGGRPRGGAGGCVAAAAVPGGGDRLQPQL